MMRTRNPRGWFVIPFVALALLCWGSRGRGAPPWAKEGEAPKPPSLSLPLDPKTAAETWQVTGELKPTTDPLLNKPVYEIARGVNLYLRSKAPVTGDYSVEAVVRFHDDVQQTGYLRLQAGVTEQSGKIDQAYQVSIGRQGDRKFYIAPYVGDGSLWTQPVRSGVKIADNAGARWMLYVGERYPLDQISPAWEEEFRVGIENDMVKVPLVKDVWRRVRIEVRSDRVRMWHNGLIVFDEPNRTRSDGEVMLQLTGMARLGELTVRPLAPVNHNFVPVALDDIVNAKGMVNPATLPTPGREVTVNGTPFVFPIPTAQGDHVDIGPSLYRYRMDVDGPGGDPLTVWPTIGQIDPARIMVRVPAGSYRRMWLVAACEGKPNTTPIVTARFFKPTKGWAIDSVAKVPMLTAQAGEGKAQKLPVKTADGKDANLWLIPIDLDSAALSSDQREELVFHLELTKEVKEFRAFPDPMNYGYFQAGLPSDVHVFALTLEKSPVSFFATSNRHGNVFPYPEKPTWKVEISNPTVAEQSARVTVDVTSPYGEKKQYAEDVKLAAGKSRGIDFQPAVREHGIYTVRTTVTSGDHVQSREGTFLCLPPDARYANEKTSKWGVWVWGGGHDTHADPADNLQLLRTLGSRIGGSFKYEDRARWGIAPNAVLQFYSTPEWALKDPYDPAEYVKYSEKCGQEVKELLKTTPDLQYVSIFAEHSISLRVTHGNPPEAWGKPWYAYTDEEKKSIKAHFIAAKAAFEGVRKHAPNVKFLLGHCGALFSLPFMRDGYPKELFDGYGVDSPQFERMAERPPRAVECNHMYFLKQEMKRLGYKKEIVHVESYYPSSHPLALGARESADSTVRTAVLSLAQGTDRFLACWTLHDCEGYWGSQHYGCIGLISRRPEYHPKPAATAFATMTQMIDTEKYDGYVPTGSRSAYCVRFMIPGRYTYCLWTIRGSRPMTLTIKPGGKYQLIDEHGNEKPLELKDGKASVTVTPTPIWVRTTIPIDKAEVGTPTYTEAPGPHRVVLDDFEKADWKYDPGEEKRYATNSWDMERVPGKMKSERVASPERKSTVWRVSLTDEAKAPTVTGRYGVFTPAQPITIPGKARAIGMHAKGNSGWGRIVYEIVDAKGEVWQSVGTKDAWNCDDTHSWSYFNFDGWRYMEFPLPGNSPGDNYREKDSVWWSHSAEGVVDLPVKLNKVIVEMPTHQIYVDEMLPVPDRTIELDDLTAVYESAEMMTDVPVKIQKAAEGTVRPKATGGAGLPNPLEALKMTGVGPATKIVKLEPPAQRNDGTQVKVVIEPVAGAKGYEVWVSPYPDGRGAKSMLKTAEKEGTVTGLRPGVELYFFVTYTDAMMKPSKPSEGVKIVLKDEFVQK